MNINPKCIHFLLYGLDRCSRTFALCSFAVGYSCPPSPVHATPTPQMMGITPPTTTSPQPSSVTIFNLISTATENPTSTDSVSEPAPTVTISTDQSAVGAQIAAAVVPASTVIVIILLIIILFLVGVGVYKRQNETFQENQGN